MSEQTIKQATIFGEVLFDCFHDQQVLGGAPFNICWHLQALGDQPVFISRVGNDELGQEIMQEAREWGLETTNIQQDDEHSTGQVNVSLVDNEPSYEIQADSAYDFIDANLIKVTETKGLLYHGSLALRSNYAQQQFKKLLAEGEWDLFVDVNLRPPWWDKQSLYDWIEQARWVKLNIDELHQLGFKKADLKEAVQDFHLRFEVEQVIVTQGAEGATVFANNKFYQVKPQPLSQFVDTVGAGDSFTAVYIHGLLHQWPIEKTLKVAQNFASKIIGIRGATPQTADFYAQLLNE